MDVRLLRCLCAVAAGLVGISSSGAQSPQTTGREVPTRNLPVPETVSPQMQALIARPLNPNFNLTPETPAQWKARVEQAARAVEAGLPTLRETLNATVEPTTIAGVKAFIVAPNSLPQAH